MDNIIITTTTPTTSTLDNNNIEQNNNSENNNNTTATEGKSLTSSFKNIKKLFKNQKLQNQSLSNQINKSHSLPSSSNTSPNISNSPSPILSVTSNIPSSTSIESLDLESINHSSNNNNSRYNSLDINIINNINKSSYSNQIQQEMNMKSKSLSLNYSPILKQCYDNDNSSNYSTSPPTDQTLKSVKNGNNIRNSSGSNSSGSLKISNSTDFNLDTSSNSSKSNMYNYFSNYLNQPNRRTPPPNLMSVLKNSFSQYSVNQPTNSRNSNRLSSNLSLTNPIITTTSVRNNTTTSTTSLNQSLQQPLQQTQQQSSQLTRSFSVSNLIMKHQQEHQLSHCSSNGSNDNEISLDYEYICNRFLRSRSELTLPSWDNAEYEGDFTNEIQDTLSKALSNGHLPSMFNNLQIQNFKDDELLKDKSKTTTTTTTSTSTTATTVEPTKTPIDKVGLIFNESGDVISGEKNKIIGLFTDISKITGTQFMDEFLFTYHYYMTAIELLDHFKIKFNNPLADTDTATTPLQDDKMRDQISTHIRLRVINVIKKWIENHGYAFIDLKLYNLLIEFIDIDVMPFSQRWGNYLRKSINDSGCLLRYISVHKDSSTIKSLREIIPLDNIDAISKLMSQSLSLKERKKGLRIIKNSFLGSEAIDWLQNRFNLDSRDEAIEILSKMLANQLIFHHSNKFDGSSTTTSTASTSNTTNSSSSNNSNNNSLPNSTNNSLPNSISSNSSILSNLVNNGSGGANGSSSPSSVSSPLSLSTNKSSTPAATSGNNSSIPLFKDKSTSIYCFIFENIQYPEPILPKSFFSSPNSTFSITFLDIHPVEIARQLTLIDYELFKRLSPTDFYHIAWSKPDAKEKVPNLISFINRSNTLSYWVATEILSFNNIKIRATALKRFITIAEILRKFNNWNTLVGILFGLHLGSIQRLKKTWECVDKKTLDSFQNLVNQTSERLNYSNYRKEVANQTYPCLPFMAVYLKDLYFIEENPDFLENGFVNFEKMKMISKILIEIKRYQTEQYWLKKIDSIEHLLKTSVVLTDKDLYKASNMCEQAQRTMTLNSLNGKPITFISSSPIQQPSTSSQPPSPTSSDTPLSNIFSSSTNGNNNSASSSLSNSSDSVTSSTTNNNSESIPSPTTTPKSEKKKSSFFGKK